MKKLYKNALPLALACGLCLLDIGSKFYFFEIIFKDEYTIKVTSFFSFSKAMNKGVSFGLFNNLEYGVIILSSIAFFIISMLLYMLFTSKGFTKYAFSLIIGGAIGNLYDRVRFGFVRDFLDFHINAYYWPTFNMADIFIFCGVAYLIIREFIKE